jgi:L-threonylcarbamoyladenylate synthase
MNQNNPTNENFDKDIEGCLKVLNEGGLILYPTDTIWGIGCDPTNASAVEKIFALKKRSDKKAMIVLMADERDVLQYVANPDLRVFDYLNQLGKPTTVIYEGAIGLAPNLTADDATVAIRICYDLFCRHLIKRFRKPLVSTSANKSGMPASKTFAEIPQEIRKGVDFVVEYRQKDTKATAASSIIKWNRDGTVTVIRE